MTYLLTKFMDKLSIVKVFVILVILVLIYFLREVLSGSLILPQTFSIGVITIHYYGITMASAVFAAFYLAVKRVPKYGIGKKRAEDLLFWIIIGGFIGARIYHVFSSFSYYWRYPIDIFKVWHGGLSIYGAVLGGLAALWIYNRRLTTTHYSLPTLLDWLAPSLVLGQIIGRFGNLFNYEAFGYPTNLPWKMFVPWQFRPQGYQDFNFFHPFFLYEALGNLIILIIILKVIEPHYKKSSPGTLGFFYILLYNLLRFGLEFLRVDSTFIGVFRLNAIVSLILVLISILALGLIFKKRDIKDIKDIKDIG